MIVPTPMGRTLPYSHGAAATRTGPKHTLSGDQFRILDISHPLVAAAGRGSLYAVADGVSSVARGREAAALTCARLDNFFDRFHTPSVESLIQIISETDWELREGGRGIAACTLALLWLANGTATVMHVGDSLVYRVRHGEALRITHSQQEGRRLGAYVGMGPRVAEALQVWKEPLFAGDLFLIVTDGVTAVLPPDELIETWWSEGGSPQRAAQAIIQEVNRRNGPDDATALVIDVLAVEADPAAEATYASRSDFRRPS